MLAGSVAPEEMAAVAAMAAMGLPVGALLAQEEMLMEAEKRATEDEEATVAPAEQEGTEDPLQCHFQQAALGPTPLALVGLLEVEEKADWAGREGAVVHRELRGSGRWGAIHRRTVASLRLPACQETLGRAEIQGRPERTARTERSALLSEVRPPAAVVLPAIHAWAAPILRCHRMEICLFAAPSSLTQPARGFV